jgi:methionyl-tRNA formyltransferase
MRLVFAGTPAAAIPSLTRLLESSHDIVAVVTRPDALTGRGRQLVASPVAVVAREHHVELLQPERPTDGSFQSRLTALAPDCCAIVAYGGLIPATLLNLPPHGWVNLHFSLLPAWRGAAPVQHALLRGDELTGASTFRLDEGLDTGPVFGAVTEQIRATDTSGDLLERLAVSGAELLVRTLDGIESGELHPVPQSSDGVSTAPKISVDDARVDWRSPAIHIDRLIRASTPTPGAWTSFRGERLGLLPVAIADEPPLLAVGEISASKSRVLVGTGSHAVVLGQVQAQGKRFMPAADWARGVRIQPGEALS